MTTVLVNAVTDAQAIDHARAEDQGAPPQATTGAAMKTGRAKDIKTVHAKVIH